MMQEDKRADGAATLPRLARALRDAAFVGLITAGLCFPMIALRAEADMTNHLVLLQRWEWLVGATMAMFAFRFASSMLNTKMARVLAALAIALLLYAAGHAYFAAFPSATTIAFGLIAGAIVLALAIAADRIDFGGAGPRAPIKLPQGTGTVVAIFALAAALAFPLVTNAWLGPQGSLKWINNYGIQILIFVMLGWGLNIVVGLAGLLDLGYVAFYAVGCYAYALLATKFGLSFWLCLPLAGILAAFWGILLGFPVLRLRGDYLAIVTLAFGEIINIVLTNWIDLTNGEAGIPSIPRVTFFGLPFTAGDDGFAARFGLEFSPIHRTIFLFYLILTLALITNFVTLRLRRLPVGRAWEALREDEIACRSLGINTTNTKLTAFALGAMFGGFAGAFFAVRQGFVNPNSFTFIESASILAIVVLGGMGSQIGVALAAAVMVGGTEALRELDFLKTLFGSQFDPSQYRMLIFGLAMVIMMIWKPRGLISTRTPSIFLKHRKAIAGDLVKEGHG
ncbi:MULTISPECIES: high-affinity branched-chain amino acid ABC transporter permease LivM [unclassified Beijerinckia]|uniref:high-affinity branched-chain amino acid ABC transporter permease LivM n=1 Tax=unclassified Beijerinckia TaxID=2638183 RepID=UPI00089C22CF|nr:MULTISPECIES: high-affinity branched-chain amino acid ABC transporter permease LivM [unclassified Beijerinckia]MDH7799825.1 branched-chain amino acid transport system permease protein [Beijerinckia sp. GAS462]SED38853.1 branched-chain amino acid transport system permease protein [Beijerinckia sp. 28-YEA-48]